MENDALPLPDLQDQPNQSKWLNYSVLLFVLVVVMSSTFWLIKQLYFYQKSFSRSAAANTGEIINSVLPLSTITNTEQAVTVSNEVLAQSYLGQPVVLDLQLQNYKEVPLVCYQSVAVSLHLDYNPLSMVEFNKLEYPEKLKVLTVSHAKLRSLSEEIGTLSNLEVLHLHYNGLALLPSTIGNLDQLTELKLDHNQLMELPATFSRLQSLETLTLESNKLIVLPSEIGNLRELKHLSLTANNLTELPNSIGQLQQLEILKLKANQLTFLPSSIRQLSKLKVLDLSDNQLSALPPELGQLQQLETLYLSGNLINPNEIEQLRAKLPNTTIIYQLK